MTNQPKPRIPATARLEIIENATKHAERMQDWMMDLALDLLIETNPDIDPESLEADRMLNDLESAMIDIWVEQFKREY